MTLGCASSRTSYDARGKAETVVYMLESDHCQPVKPGDVVTVPAPDGVGVMWLVSPTYLERVKGVAVREAVAE